MTVSESIDEYTKLIRVWDHGFSVLRGQKFVQWDHGRFVVAVEDPIAIELWRNRERTLQFTVEKTTELVWLIDRMVRDPEVLTVYCRPQVEVLRNVLVPDLHLIEQWLTAERQWIDDVAADEVRKKKSCLAGNLRNRIAEAIRRHPSEALQEYCHRCGWRDVGGDTDDYADHVADAVIAELGLQRESAQDGFAPIDDLPAGVHRYVTDWKASE